MKRVILCLFLLLPLGGRAQISSSCTPSKALVSLYTNDAKDMALERMYQLKSPDTALIEIPQLYTDSILGVIAAVCNIEPQFETDSIFRNYCIHRWPERALLSTVIQLKVDTSYSWAKQWFLGKKLTADAAIDSFLSRHGVVLQSYNCCVGSSLFNNVANLKAILPINMRAFADSMLQFPGALYCHFLPRYGTGDNIYFSADSAWHIRFFAGWGDCPSGCTSGKQWLFTVSKNDCSVRKDTVITGPYNYDQRIFSNCNLTPASVWTTKGFAPGQPFTFPNPMNDLLQVNKGDFRLTRYRITDAMGRVFSEGNCSGTEEINVSFLPQGVYAVSLWDNDGRVVVRRFIKQ